MRYSEALRRPGWLLCGALAVLAGAEALLRLAGAAARRGSGPRSDDAPFTILAEGDSFTYGVGGVSFPAQLEALLNERAGKRLVRVVNKGVPGLNTAQLVERLEAHLEAYRPDAVVIVVGENNWWNFLLASGAFRGLPLRVAVERQLLRLRVYKLARLMWIGWGRSAFRELALARLEDDAPPLEDAAPPEGLLAQANALEDRWEYDRAVTLYRHYIASHPEDPQGYLDMGLSLLRLDRLEEALRILEAGIGRLSGAGPHVEEAGGSLYHQSAQALERLGRDREAAQRLVDGLRRFPGYGKLFVALVRHHWRRGESWRAVEETRRLPGIEANKMYSAFRAVLSRARGREAKIPRLVSESLRADIREISRRARARGVPVVFGSYPGHSYEEIRQAALESGMAYLDFRPLFAGFKDEEEYTSPDHCHLNTLGYRVMAEAFARELRPWLPEAPR